MNELDLMLDTNFLLAQFSQVEKVPCSVVLRHRYTSACITTSLPTCRGLVTVLSWLHLLKGLHTERIRQREIEKMICIGKMKQLKKLELPSHIYSIEPMTYQ